MNNTTQGEGNEWSGRVWMVRVHKHDNIDRHRSDSPSVVSTVRQLHQHRVLPCPHLPPLLGGQDGGDDQQLLDPCQDHSLETEAI